MKTYSKVGLRAVIYRVIRDLPFGIVSIFLVSSLIAGALFIFEVGEYAGVIFVGLLLVQFIIFSLALLLEYFNLAYVIEDNSISFREGVFSVKTITIPYAKITNVSFSQSLFQRLFGVGNIFIDQEDSEYSWKGVDTETAHKIIEEISKKSNIQPIAAQRS